MLPDIYDPQQLNRYAYVRNNPLKYVDPSGNAIAAAGVLAAISTIAMSAGLDFAADFAIQLAFDYYFNPNTDSWGEAFGNVDPWQSARSAYEGFIPVKSKKLRLLKALGTASIDVGVNKWNGGSNYGSDQALQDFAVGAISDLTGQGLNHLIGKYGAKAVARGLGKMGMGVGKIINIIGKEKVATKIANGHALSKHGGEFGSNTNLSQLVLDTINGATETQPLPRGRMAYRLGNNVVIVDINHKDLGTVFTTKDKNKLSKLK